MRKLIKIKLLESYGPYGEHALLYRSWAKAHQGKIFSVKSVSSLEASICIKSCGCEQCLEILNHSNATCHLDEEGYYILWPSEYEEIKFTEKWKLTYGGKNVRKSS